MLAAGERLTVWKFVYWLEGFDDKFSLVKNRSVTFSDFIGALARSQNLTFFYQVQKVENKIDKLEFEVK